MLDREGFDRFKWSCLLLAVLAALALGWIINDVRLDVKRNAQLLHERLPEILANSKQSSEALAAVSQDIKQLRNLAGVGTEGRDRSLVAYADEILDDLQQSGARIGLTKKVFGTGMKDVLPANEWVVAARKEALWLTFSSKSREELLTRLSQNKFGSDWYLELDGQAPTKLLDYLRAKHPPEVPSP